MSDLDRSVPFCSESDPSTWWVFADDPGTALKIVWDHDEHRQHWFGPVHSVTLCVVRQAQPGDDLYAEYQGQAVVECRYSTDEGAEECWKVTTSDDPPERIGEALGDRGSPT